jgi:tripartite-type tricarboxylate transporter receptor subunit TctC
MTDGQRPRRGAILLRIALIAAALAPTTVPSRAADYFAGKTIRLIVGNDEVGGYAVYAKLLAPVLARYIPGKPSIVVQFMPGGGGITMGNYMANAASRDGLTIGMIPRGTPLQPLIGNKAATFRAEEFTWLGTSSSYLNDAYGLIVRADTPYDSIASLQKAEKPVPFGGEAVGGTDSDFLLLTKHVFDLNIQVVRGYRGQNEIAMAMMRNEVVGRAFGMSALQLFNADWLKAGRIRFLVQFRPSRWEKLPDVPTAQELTTREEQRTLLQIVETPLLLARPYLAPPGIPAEATAILRKAFMDAHQDAEYLAVNKKANSEISPLDGAEVQRIVAKLMQTPPDVIERYKAALRVK